ncbi:fibronectin/fibrinogen binding protein [Streptococcus pneumoniae]|nr:fibronectin/fibrinogen binding protein [Streptococcus pneumoniae]
MSFDGFFLHHIVEELRSELVNGRIQKINQPFEQELVLQIRSNRQSHRLLLSAHPVFGRIQLTQTTFENPAQPSTFIMVMTVLWKLQFPIKTRLETISRLP